MKKLTKKQALVLSAKMFLKEWKQAKEIVNVQNWLEDAMDLLTEFIKINQKQNVQNK